MSSKAQILKGIRAGKPASLPLPELPQFPVGEGDVVTRFMEIVAAIGGQCTLGSLETLAGFYEGLKRAGVYVINLLSNMEQDTAFDYSCYAAIDLEKVDTVIIKGSLGVAENGAVWVVEQDMQNRLLPFICQHLVLVVNAKDLVPTMHQAYEIIRINEQGYGVFIAGPSKTADIEQSLVVGAHGPLSLQVFLIEQ